MCQDTREIIGPPAHNFFRPARQRICEGRPGEYYSRLKNRSEHNLEGLVVDGDDEDARAV